MDAKQRKEASKELVNRMIQGDADMLIIGELQKGVGLATMNGSSEKIIKILVSTMEREKRIRKIILDAGIEFMLKDMIGKDGFKPDCTDCDEQNNCETRNLIEAGKVDTCNATEELLKKLNLNKQ